LKQRLVGAIVLVALGVIFIPMLLEGPNRTLVPEMDEMPTPEALAPELPLKPFPPAAEPVEAQRAVVTDASVEKAPEKPAPSTPSSSELPAAKPAPVSPKPAPERKTSIRAEKPPASVSSWVVQVVSLSNEANALALRDKLRKGGFATQVERVKVSGKTRYRVRVGPFLQRAEAERVRKQIAGHFSQNGRVMSYP